MGGSLPIPVGVVLAAALIVGAIDFCQFRVSNRFTFPLLLAGLVYHTVTHGLPGLADSLVGMLLGFSLLFPLYLLGGTGGGDVKFMAALGAWLGAPLTLVAFLATSLATGVYAVVLVLACGRVRETWVNLQIAWFRLTAFSRHLGAEDQVEAALNDADRRQRAIPFVAMVALGLLGLLLWMHLFNQG